MPSRSRDTAATRAATTRDLRSGEPLAESGRERLRRRALFLRELHEARELRARVRPRRARAARMRQQMRMRTFRW